MDQTNKLFNRILSFAGITLFSKHNRDSFAWRSYQILNIIISLSAIIFTANFFIYNFWNFSESIQAACLSFIFGIQFLNLSTFFYYRKDFESYLDEMVFNDPEMEMPLIKDVIGTNTKDGRHSEFKILIASSKKKWIILSGRMLKLYWTSVLLSVTLYYCGPVYLIFFRKGGTSRILPLLMELPWSIDDDVAYFITFLYEAHTGYLCCIAYPCFLSLLILFYLQIIRQLKLLTYILENLDEMMLEVSGNRDRRWQAACTLGLSQCIIHYLKIKRIFITYLLFICHFLIWLMLISRFTNRLNATCKMYFLIMILISMSLEGICFMEIAFSHDLNINTIKYAGILFVLVMGIFVLCYLGQLIENACTELEEGVTEKWYIYNKKHRINLLIFYMALRQQMPVFIYGSVTLSLETFTWFIKTGMSFFTVVKSVLEE